MFFQYVLSKYGWFHHYINLFLNYTFKDLYFRVLMLGSSGVGKSALCSQFMSSDHINTYIKIG